MSKDIFLIHFGIKLLQYITFRGVYRSIITISGYISVRTKTERIHDNHLELSVQYDFVGTSGNFLSITLCFKYLTFLQPNPFQILFKTLGIVFSTFHLIEFGRGFLFRLLFFVFYALIKKV